MVPYDRVLYTVQLYSVLRAGAVYTEVRETGTRGRTVHGRVTAGQKASGIWDSHLQNRERNGATATALSCT